MAARDGMGQAIAFGRDLIQPPATFALQTSLLATHCRAQRLRARDGRGLAMTAALRGADLLQAGDLLVFNSTKVDQASSSARIGGGRLEPADRAGAVRDGDSANVVAMRT
jgi:hypothetical protein